MNRFCRMGACIVAISGILTGTSAVRAADNPLGLTPAAPLTMDSLLRTDRSGLEALYRGAAAGSVPVGSLSGRAIPAPGTRGNLRKSKLLGLLWKGKEFPAPGLMVNHLALGIQAVKAEVYYGSSWLDGAPTIVLDYANTSRLFSKVRDEMREVSPGLYLGLTYIRTSPEPKLATYYTVQLPSVFTN